MDSAPAGAPDVGRSCRDVPIDFKWALSDLAAVAADEAGAAGDRDRGGGSLGLEVGEVCSECVVGTGSPRPPRPSRPSIPEAERSARSGWTKPCCAGATPTPATRIQLPLAQACRTNP